MKQKRFFLFNPIWIGAVAAALILVGIFLDIICYNPSRRYYHSTPGVMCCIISGILIDFAYTWLFLGKLARKYPEQREEILTIRRMLAIHTNKNRDKLSKMQISFRNAVSHFSDDSLEFQQINDEWETGIKWIKYALISLLLVLPAELIICNWMAAVRPAVLNYLNSIGL